MEKKGVWRTINGRKVFIEEGQSVKDAYNKSIGKNQETKKETKDNNSKPFKKEISKEDKKKEVLERAKKKTQAKKEIKEKIESKKVKKVDDNKTSELTGKEINNYKPKNLYDVGYVPERESLDYANKHNLFTINKTMADGKEIGDNDKEGLKDIGGPTVSYTMSNDRYYNLSKEERIAINKIISNNKKAEKLEVDNTDIINKKSSRKDWHKHLGEAGKHTHETKDGKGYYDELKTKDKLRIINNDRKIEELKKDSIKQAKILDNGPTKGKYPLGSDTDSKWKKINNKIGDKLDKKEKSSGIIVLDKGKVLLVEHSDGRFGFPKGHAEKGESERKTALREVLEETSYNVKIKNGFRQPTQYTAKNGETKTEVYFVGTPKSKNKTISNTGELKGAKFYSIDEARKKLKNYGNLVSILDRATKSSKENINIGKLKSLGEIKQFLISRGYSEETATKYAQEYIIKRKNKR